MYSFCSSSRYMYIWSARYFGKRPTVFSQKHTHRTVSVLLWMTTFHMFSIIGGLMRVEYRIQVRFDDIFIDSSVNVLTNSWHYIKIIRPKLATWYSIDNVCRSYCRVDLFAVLSRELVRLYRWRAQYSFVFIQIHTLTATHVIHLAIAQTHATDSIRESSKHDFTYISVYSKDVSKQLDICVYECYTDKYDNW